jgi:hypothetical protein
MMVEKAPEAAQVPLEIPAVHADTIWTRLAR